MITTIKTFGNSMLPFFKDGDVLILKKIPYSYDVPDDWVRKMACNAP